MESSHSDPCDIVGLLVTKPDIGKSYKSGDTIEIEFISGPGITTIDEINLTISWEGKAHILDTDVTLTPPGQKSYTLKYVLPDGLKPDARYSVGVGSLWMAQSCTFSINEPNWGLSIVKPELNQYYKSGEHIVIKWTDPFDLYRNLKFEFIKICTFNNVNNLVWTSVLARGVPIADGRRLVKLPDKLSVHKGYTIGVRLNRDGRNEDYYSNAFTIVGDDENLS